MALLLVIYVGCLLKPYLMSNIYSLIVLFAELKTNDLNFSIQICSNTPNLNKRSIGIDNKIFALMFSLLLFSLGFPIVFRL